MALLVAGPAGLNVDAVPTGGWSNMTWTAHDTSHVVGHWGPKGNPGRVTEFAGYGFGYTETTFLFSRYIYLTEGTLSTLQETQDGTLLYRLEGMGLPVRSLGIGAAQGSLSYFLSIALNGDDTLRGSAQNDLLRGYGGRDLFDLGAGDDTAEGGSGDDTINGGAGLDTVLLSNRPSSYEIQVFNGVAGVLSRSWNGEVTELDRLTEVEQLRFTATGEVVTLGANTFSAEQYMAANPDLAFFDGNPGAAFDHYLSYGAREGRAASFDGLQYIASYADLSAALGTNAQAGAEHFLRNGHAEGRQIIFDGFDYIASNPDLIAAFGAHAEAGAVHYIRFGRAEGRQITFDGLDYIASYADLSAAFGTNAEAGAAHYIQFGRAEGRQTRFDGLEYIASHPDLIAAFGANAEAGATHYITIGRVEHRGTDSFDAAQYLANYADLRAAFGSDLEAATRHWILNGHGEGRSDEPLIG